MFKNSNFIKENYALLDTIALAFDFMEDELIDVDNIIDAFNLAYEIYVDAYGYEYTKWL